MWPFGGKKDHNIVSIMFEKADSFKINANRGKGDKAEKIKRNMKLHELTIFWAVFDQKGGILESGPGRGENHVPARVLRQLEKEIHTNLSVREILKMLESGQTDRAAKKLIWSGYPRKEE